MRRSPTDAARPAKNRRQWIATRTVLCIGLGLTRINSIAMTALDSSKYFPDPTVAAFVDDVQRGQAGKVSAALKLGMDPNAKGLQGIRPIHFVFAARDAEVLRLLLAAGADPNAKTPLGQTPLHYAVQQRSASFTEALLQHHADPNLGGENGEPVLYAAIDSPVADAVLPMLAKAGADLSQVFGGYPPVQSAMVRQAWRSAALLLQLGSNPQLLTKQGESAARTFCRLIQRIPVRSPSRQWIAEVGDRLSTTTAPLPCAELYNSFKN